MILFFSYLLNFKTLDGLVILTILCKKKTWLIGLLPFEERISLNFEYLIVTVVSRYHVKEEPNKNVGSYTECL